MGLYRRVKRYRYLCHGHGARDKTDVRTDSGQKANLQTVNRLVELIDLLLLGRLMVPLIGDGGVGLGIDVGGFEWFRHVEDGCRGKSSACRPGY